MAAARIKGVLSPVVTPFKRDLSPDVGRFIAHCKWLLSQDCGLAVFGTNSEANSMSARERTGLLDAIVSAGVPTDRMMPGTGACSINEAAEVSAHATRLGVGFDRSCSDPARLMYTPRISKDAVIAADHHQIMFVGAHS